MSRKTSYAGRTTRKHSGRKASPLPTFAIGERVDAGGKAGTVRAILDMNSVNVELDNQGGTFRYGLDEVARLAQ